MYSKRKPINTQEVFSETHLSESIIPETFSTVVSMHEQCFNLRGVVVEGLSKIALRDIAVPLTGEQLETTRDNSKLAVDIDALGVYGQDACVAMVGVNLSSQKRAALIGMQTIEQGDGVSLYLSSQTSFVVPGLATAIQQRLAEGEDSAVRKVGKLENKELQERWKVAISSSLTKNKT